MQKENRVKITIINSTTKSILSGLIVAGIFSFVLYAFAIPPDSPYTPGYTLTPDCVPNSENCTVVPPANYSFGANDFSGTGTFTTTDTGTFGTITDGIFSVTAGAITGATGSNNMWTNDAGYLTTETDLLTRRGSTSRIVL